MTCLPAVIEHLELRSSLRICLLVLYLYFFPSKIPLLLHWHSFKTKNPYLAGIPYITLCM
jgi:hypothetical protein